MVYFKLHNLKHFFCFLFILSISGCSDNQSTSLKVPQKTNEFSNANLILEKLEKIDEKVEKINELEEKIAKLEEQYVSVHNTGLSTDSSGLPDVERILEKTNLNIQDAAAIGDILRVKELLDKGAEVNLIDQDGFALIHHASINGRSKVINLLIKAGADINILDKDNLTALNRAQLIGHKETIDILVENGAVASKVINPETAETVNPASVYKVMDALQEDSVEVLKEQEKLKFDFVGAKLPNNKSLLQTAASNGSFKVIKYFIENIIIDKKFKPDSDLIIEALSSLYTRSVDYKSKILVEKYSKTIEILAKKYPFLLNSKKENYAPLHIAISTHDIPMIKFLVGLGADLNQVGPDDRSPIIFAITTADHNHDDENKMDHDHLEGEHGHQLEMVSLLIKSGSNINSKGFKNRSALIESIMVGKVNISEYLIDSGLDVNQADDDGVTPLHMAAYYGHYKLCEMLIQRNADRNAMVKIGPKKGLKPVDAAKDGKHVEIVKLLSKS